MLKKAARIENGKKKYDYITSDSNKFVDAYEAEWHEFTICKLKGRKINIEVPEHNVYSFSSHEEIIKYLKENYGHMNYAVKANVNELAVPDNYVVFDKEVFSKGAILHVVDVISLKVFKENLIEKILEQK